VAVPLEGGATGGATVEGADKKRVNLKISTTTIVMLSQMIPLSIEGSPMHAAIIAPKRSRNRQPNICHLLLLCRVGRTPPRGWHLSAPLGPGATSRHESPGRPPGRPPAPPPPSDGWHFLGQRYFLGSGFSGLGDSVSTLARPWALSTCRTASLLKK
jgi:hypothetical protein